MIENVLTYEEQIKNIVSENAIQLVNYDDYGIDFEEEIIERYGNCIEKLQNTTDNQIVLLENKYFEVGEFHEEMEGMVAYYDTLAITDFHVDRRFEYDEPFKLLMVVV